MWLTSEHAREEHVDVDEAEELGGVLLEHPDLLVDEEREETSVEEVRTGGAGHLLEGREPRVRERQQPGLRRVERLRRVVEVHLQLVQLEMLKRFCILAISV